MSQTRIHFGAHCTSASRCFPPPRLPPPSPYYIFACASPAFWTLLHSVLLYLPAALNLPHAVAGVLPVAPYRLKTPHFRHAFIRGQYLYAYDCAAGRLDGNMTAGSYRKRHIVTPYAHEHHIHRRQFCQRLHLSNNLRLPSTAYRGTGFAGT